MEHLPETSMPAGPPPDSLLHQQKRELDVLHSIFQIISSTSRLSDTLEQVLDFVLDMVQSSVGWVCLHDQDGGCTSFTGYKGLCFSNPEGQNTPCLAHCVCDRVRKTKDVVVINHLTKGCPLLLIEGEPEELIAGHISIPLMTSARLVGQLNIAFGQSGRISPPDVALLRAIGPQLAVVVENARLRDELQTKESMLKNLLNKVVAAQEEERRRISRELHDEMGQNLTSLLIGMSVLEKTDACCAKEDLIHGMTQTVTGMIDAIHDLALDLRPPMLDELGLLPTLAQYIQACPERLGLQVDYQMVGPAGRRLSHEAEITVYRMVQESLTNVARHSNAARASVILNQGPDALRVIIEDNGVGFDLHKVKAGKAKPRHLGLFGMEERAALVGGTLTVESSPGAGTSIYIEIPWDREANA